MKKIILAIIIAVASVSIVSAQVSFGLRGGFNSSTYVMGIEKISYTTNLGNNPGFYVGGLVSVPIGEIFAFQPEINYSYDGTRFAIKKSFIVDLGGPDSIGTIAVSAITHNINVPLLFKLSPSKSLGVVAGPYFSYTVGHDVKFNKNLKKVFADAGVPITGLVSGMIVEAMDDNSKNFNLGFSFGAEYVFNGGFFIDTRYNVGLLNVVSKEIKYGGIVLANWDDIGIMPKIKHSSFHIGIGYKF